MSQTTNVQKLTIRNRKGAEGKLTVGANTEVLLDGKPLKGLTFIKVEINAKKIAKVMMELYVELDIEVNTSLESKYVEKTDLVIQSKPVALHSVGSYAPTDVALKPVK